MTAPLDRIRAQSAAAPARPSARTPSPPTPVPAPTGRTPDRTGDVETLLRARRGAPANLSGMRPAATAVGVLSLTVACGHRWLTGWTAITRADGGVFSLDWMIAVLTFAQVHRWGPFVAAAVVIGLVALAIATEGLAHGYGPQAIGVAGAVAVGAIVGVPMIIALVIGFLTLVVYLVIVALMVVAGVTILGALASSAFD